MARMTIFVVLFPGWKCHGQVGPVMVESEHWDGDRSMILIVLLVLARFFPSISPRDSSSELYYGVTPPNN